MIRERETVQQLLANERLIKSLRPAVARINELESRYAPLSPDDLRIKARELRERVREAGDGRITKIWFARERGWLPLRIKQYEADGETLDMRITAIR